MKRAFIALLVIFISCNASAAEGESPPDLRSLMSADDFSASGLDRLSKDELEHLADWVERYREGAVIGPEVVKKPSQQTPVEREVAKVEKEEKKKFELIAKVIPRFKGWTGKTVFKLDNGQVWQQRQNGKMHYSGADSTVVITTNLFGGYVLKHAETKRSIGVRRVE